MDIRQEILNLSPAYPFQYEGDWSVYVSLNEVLEIIDRRINEQSIQSESGSAGERTTD